MISIQGMAQNMQGKVQKDYALSASEFIFSWGRLDDPVHHIDPVVRFSGFFHVQEQGHHDFNNVFGIYSGFGIRNVGFINRVNDSIKIKQRSYSAGIPVAIKVGNMKKQTWLALGGEAEIMFAYKQKVFYAGEKFKDHEWFSEKVNIFNPSVFAELHFKEGSYLRFKYYINNFLREENQEVKLFGAPFSFRPESSKLLYISVGKSIPHKKLKRNLNRKNKGVNFT